MAAAQTDAARQHATCTTPEADAAAIVQALAIPVLVINVDGGVCYRNEAAARVLGAGATIGQLLRGARMSDGFSGWDAEIARLDTAAAPRRLDAYLPADEQSATRMLAVSLAPLPAPQRLAANLILVTIEDVSWRAGLEQRMTANERLVALGKLAARVAHELNNPLDGILRYINLSLRVLKDSDESKVRQYLGESRTGLLRMAGIVRELLEFSRASRGEFDVTGINDVADQSIRDYMARATEQGIIIAADFQDPALPGVRGNRLYQVCCNLLKNAIEAMPGGGRITVTTGRIGDHAVLRVADTGAGLPDDAARVFEPFFTTKDAGKGTGLGLAICRDYVTDMGGTIEAVAGDGGGAVFTVRLPLAKCHSVDTSGVARGEALGAGGREGRQP